MVVAIIIALGNKQRAKAGIRNATLSKLRCKKEEMNRRENKIYYLIDLLKKNVISKESFETQVSYEYEQLKISYNEYKLIKLELSEDDLRTEKEDFGNSISHISSLITTLTGAK